MKTYPYPIYKQWQKKPKDKICTSMQWNVNVGRFKILKGIYSAKVSLNRNCHLYSRKLLHYILKQLTICMYLS